MTGHARCGPEGDPEFFKDLDAVFAKHPDAARRYSVRCLALETDLLKVDFAKQVGVSRIEAGRIVTEFRNRDEFGNDGEDEPLCCEFAGEAPHEFCVRYCEL
ncbi:hypothetical protein [Kitasatospora sp. CB01950]|uniref:hypothetical protein n=1 Tax=Kitasatospora sp. CB01950 TaxID=1703930 RepID=UPI001161446D|nr:hypothetical protein [Kitasatospora sp. CB01950]